MDTTKYVRGKVDGDGPHRIFISTVEGIDAGSTFMGFCGSGEVF